MFGGLRISRVEQCKECELAVYCYSDSSSWIFRTMQEMGEKKDAIANCPLRQSTSSTMSTSSTKKKNAIAKCPVRDRVEQARGSDNMRKESTGE
jgi:hypothetical protein